MKPKVSITIVYLFHTHVAYLEHLRLHQDNPILTDGSNLNPPSVNVVGVTMQHYDTLTVTSPARSLSVLLKPQRTNPDLPRPFIQ